jgi:hypothetical protein
MPLGDSVTVPLVVMHHKYKCDTVTLSLGFNDDASPVQFSLKSIQHVKRKSFSLDQLASGADRKESFKALKLQK